MKSNEIPNISNLTITPPSAFKNEEKKSEMELEICQKNLEGPNLFEKYLKSSPPNIYNQKCSKHNSLNTIFCTKDGFFCCKDYYINEHQLHKFLSPEKLKMAIDCKTFTLFLLLLY